MSRINTLRKKSIRKKRSQKMGRLDYRLKVINPQLRVEQKRIQGEHYPYCERCGSRNTTFAHSKKGFDPATGERWLPTDPDHPNYGYWFIVAYLCIPCHDLAEGLGHERMEQEILGFRERRKG